jgi:hypothetical protein
LFLKTKLLVLDPKNFWLRDPEAERKYEMKTLQWSLYAAKSGGARLLAGNTFYFTAGMPEKIQGTLAKVIQASGGSVSLIYQDVIVAYCPFRSRSKYLQMGRLVTKPVIMFSVIPKTDQRLKRL